MTPDATSPHHVSVPMEGNRQVVMRPDWLPADSPFAELTELATEHRDTLQDLKDIGVEIRTLSAKYEAEDAKALEIARQAYLDGEDNPKLPKRTPQMERDARLMALRDKATIIQESLQVLIEEVVSTIQQNEESWCDVLRERELEANEKVRVLREQLLLAEQEALRQPDMRDWLQRTAKNRTGWHLQWAWYLDKEATAPTDLLTIANMGRNQYNSQPSAALSAQDSTIVESSDTGERPDVRAEDVRAGGGEVAAKVPDYSDETMDYGSPEYLDRLDDELKRHVERQRAGDAAPGGL